MDHRNAVKGCYCSLKVLVFGEKGFLKIDKLSRLTKSVDRGVDLLK